MLWFVEVVLAQLLTVVPVGNLHNGKDRWHCCVSKAFKGAALFKTRGKRPDPRFYHVIISEYFPYRQLSLQWGPLQDSTNTVKQCDTKINNNNDARLKCHSKSDLLSSWTQFKSTYTVVNTPLIYRMYPEFINSSKLNHRPCINVLPLSFRNVLSWVCPAHGQLCTKAKTIWLLNNKLLLLPSLKLNKYKCILDVKDTPEYFYCRGLEGLVQAVTVLQLLIYLQLRM